MRQPNIELNKSKLELKKLQLTQIEIQLKALQTKINDVLHRHEAKLNEVNELNSIIETAQNQVTVSK